MSVSSPTTRYRVKQRRAETSYKIENGSGLIDKPAGWSAEESIGQARRLGGAGCNKGLTSYQAASEYQLLKLFAYIRNSSFQSTTWNSTRA